MVDEVAYPHAKWILYAFGAISVVYVWIGVRAIWASGPTAFNVSQLLFALMWSVAVVLYARRPFATAKHDGLAVVTNMVLPAREISWSAIEDIRRSRGSIATLVLSGGDEVVLRLSNIAPDDAEALLDLIDARRPKLPQAAG